MNSKALVLDLLFRISIFTLIVLGILPIMQFGSYLLMFAGLLSGTYYGWHNDIVWDTEETLKPNASYRVHQLWIHIVCGVIAGITLYLLANRYFSSPEEFTSRFDWLDFFLFLISTLGWTGLLPRTLWFFARSGHLTGP